MSPTLFTPTQAAYDQLRQDAAQVDRSERLRLTFAGAQAADTLSGLVTNDVLAVQPGHGQYAAALTPKGRIIADVRIFRRDSGDFLVDASAASAPGFLSMIRKYVNPRFTKCDDVSGTLSCIGVVGPHARQVIAHALACLPAAFDLLPPFASCDVPFDDQPLLVARVPDFGVDAFDCFVDAAQAGALIERLLASGATRATADALEVLRIEAGRPAWGADMSDDTLAHEAALDTLDAISYTKGCYTGQEVVARVHFRGHVNRVLRGLRAESPPAGDARVWWEEADVGDVRSRALSPRLGAIALAMLRREVEPGSAVTIRSSEGDVSATVTTLPFPV